MAKPLLFLPKNKPPEPVLTPGFVVLMPVYGSLSAATDGSLDGALRSGVPFVRGVRAGDSLITSSRSHLASMFLAKSIFDYAVWVDGDIQFEPWQLAKIYDDLQQGYDLIGGLYLTKGGKAAADGDGRLVVDGEIHPVRCCGAGFLGMSKRLLQEMAGHLPACLNDEGDYPLYPFFESGAYQDHERGWLMEGEDANFCRKAKQKIGVQCHVDTAVQVTHWQTRPIRVEDAPGREAV